VRKEALGRLIATKPANEAALLCRNARDPQTADNATPAFAANTRGNLPSGKRRKMEKNTILRESAMLHPCASRNRRAHQITTPLIEKEFSAAGPAQTSL
jgi:hypothetical protein